MKELTGTDLVSRGGIAERAGTTPGMVDAWRRRNISFPEPEGYVGRSPAWSWRKVEQWMANRLPAGRPRSRS